MVCLDPDSSTLENRKWKCLRLVLGRGPIIKATDCEMRVSACVLKGTEDEFILGISKWCIRARQATKCKR